MKKTLEKVPTKIRPRKERVRASPTDSVLREAPATAGTPLAATGMTISGRTIYGDRPLRFRGLSVPDPGLPPVEDRDAFPDAFKIRIGRPEQAPREAQFLVARRYGGRGYEIPVVVRDPHLMTFLAYDEGQVVGTVSMRLDSEEKGLSSDDLYRVENDQLRAKGWRLCEYTRLAVDTAVASKPVLGTLFHAAYMYAAIVRGYTYSVIEVNPRHVSFYAKKLRFEPLGPARMNTHVNAPAVLLGVPLAAIGAGIDKYAGKETDDRAGAMFRFFLPPHDQPGVLNRLRKLVEPP